MGNAISVYDTGSWDLRRYVDLHAEWARGAAFADIAYVSGTSTWALGGYQIEQIQGRIESVGKIWFFRPDDATPQRQFKPYVRRGDEPIGDVIRLAISPSGDRIATGTSTGSGFSETQLIKASVHVLNADDGKLLAEPLDGKSQGAQFGLEYTADGRYLIVGESGIETQHAVHIIDAKTLEELDLVHAGNTLYDLAVDPRSAQFAVAAGGRITLWSLPPKL